MSPRWNWDFEDGPRGARSSPPSPPKPPPPSSPGGEPGNPRDDARFRRRRLGAALAFVALVIVLVVVLSGSHHGSSVSSAGARAQRAASPRAVSPLDAQERGEKAIDSVLAYTPFVRGAGTSGHDVALTFDDGPGPYTPGVLDVLERERVPATFFIVGQEVPDFRAAAEREVRAGFEIGDHTENHPMLAHLSAHDQHEQLFEQAARIELLGGRKPRLFRPPYGSFNATTFRLLHQMRLLMVLWSVDTDDYERPGVEVIVQRALEGAKPGAIILMHDAGGDRSQTIAALPEVIRRIRARGLHLVTVAQLLADDPPPAGQPLPQNLSGD
ncbi:MAG TPA: polysaccharide deacetylase family protein [Solirubrobacteraceae bacterium]|jgi:peptidoglycan/xylan/chitin deacetylase (PgdA/CDA1 family)|nr:polysaccharide deacetylase family protein [Solirubrobacteraceae bacterium]